MHLLDLDRAGVLALGDFIARHNAAPERHVASLADAPQAVREEVAGFGDDEFRACAAYDGAEPAGIFLAEYDRELARAWLKGPIVAADDPAAWRTLAAALLQRIETLLPAGIDQVQLFFDERALLLADFAREHGFVARPYASLSMALSVPTVERSLREAVVVLPRDLRADFATLHEATFPGAYFTSERLVESRDPRRWLFVHRAGASLSGYICGSVSAQLREAYVDFLGVREASRRKGVGAVLLLGAASELRAQHGIESLRLTVRSTDDPAVGLYAKLGMRTLRSMRAFERARRHPC